MMVSSAAMKTADFRAEADSWRNGFARSHDNNCCPINHYAFYGGQFLTPTGIGKKGKMYPFVGLHKTMIMIDNENAYKWKIQFETYFRRIYIEVSWLQFFSYVFRGLSEGKSRVWQ